MVPGSVQPLEVGHVRLRQLKYMRPGFFSDLLCFRVEGLSQ